MKKYFIIFLVLFFRLNLNAEGPRSDRRANPNYKYLKVYAKVLQPYKTNNAYLAQIEILNTGNSSVSFFEPTSSYVEIFSFTAAGVWFINQNQLLYYEKKIAEVPLQKTTYKKVRILPRGKYVIKTMFYIYNRERFMQTNKNLKLAFYFNDANLQYREDETNPYILSENTIVYKW